MTTAFPAGVVLTHLSLAEKRESISVLQDMTTTEREIARTLLEQVGPGARIDPGALVVDVRQRVIAQAEADARRPSAPAWKYAITLMSDDQCEQFRQAVEGGDDPDTAATRAMASAPPPPSPWLSSNFGTAYDDDEEPDDEDDEPAKPKRRSVPRKRLRSRRLPKPKSKRAPKSKPEPFALGGIATFDQFGRTSPDPSFTPLRPLWLLDDLDDGETDDETDEEETA
jgi:hypothetical protein